MNQDPNDYKVDDLLDKATDWVTAKLPDVARSLGKILVGIAILTLALFYFLADGPQFIHTIMLLSPLDPEYEEELLNRFSNVSRAVVSASLLSAVAQGLLAGIGFYFALNAGAPLFLLTALVMVFAVVPFVGAAGIWIPTCLWIYFYQIVQRGGEATLDAAGNPVVGDTVSAIALTVYCGLVVSMIDNLIKPWVLHGQSNLHPLLALLSVLGGVVALGPAGLLIGPMVVAFVQALLVMVNKELARMADEEQGSPGPHGGLSGVPFAGAVMRGSSHPGKRTAGAKAIAAEVASHEPPAEKLDSQENKPPTKESGKQQKT